MYAQSFTAGNLETFMEKKKIDPTLWPDPKQIENLRSGLKPKLNRHSIACLGELKKFVGKAPDDVAIDERRTARQGFEYNGTHICVSCVL